MTHICYRCRCRLAARATGWTLPAAPFPAAGSASEEGCEFLLALLPFVCSSRGPWGSDLLHLAHPLALPVDNSLIASSQRQPLWVRVCGDHSRVPRVAWHLPTASRFQPSPWFPLRSLVAQTHIRLTTSPLLFPVSAGAGLQPLKGAAQLRCLVGAARTQARSRCHRHCSDEPWVIPDAEPSSPTLCQWQWPYCSFLAQKTPAVTHSLCVATSLAQLQPRLG